MALLCAITTTVEALELFYGDHKMKTQRLVYGVGVNDADYVTQRHETIGYVGGKQKQKLAWICPYFRVWRNMLKRCNEKWQERYPTYAGCTVSEGWHTFSAFKDWMMAQDWEGLELDKDILIKGNKVYGPDTCVFVTKTVNSFTLDRGAARGEWLIGMYWNKEKSKFIAQCSNPFTRKQEHLGYFTCEQEAHNAWLKRKNELAHELAAIQPDPRVAKALTERYSNH